MPRKIRHTVRALVIASAGLLLVGSFGVATAAALTGRPAADRVKPATAHAQDDRVRHAVALPFFSFRRGG